MQPSQSAVCTNGNCRRNAIARAVERDHRRLGVPTAVVGRGRVRQVMIDKMDRRRINCWLQSARFAKRIRLRSEQPLAQVVCLLSDR